jgi:hypothetical protein
VLGKKMIALVAIATIYLALPTTASAGGAGYYGYPHRYGSYYKWPYGVTTFYGRFSGFGGCRLVRERVWTPFGWNWREYEVCG